MTCYRTILAGLLGFILTLCPGCGSGSGPSTDLNDDTLAADTSKPECSIEPTLASLTTDYFEKSCNFGSCHGENAAGGLDLRPDVAFSNLVNVQAYHAGATGKFLVVPGKPDESFLVQKLEEPGATEGNLMPMGATESMDPECRIAMLRQWIGSGAAP